LAIDNHALWLASLYKVTQAHRRTRGSIETYEFLIALTCSYRHNATCTPILSSDFSAPVRGDSVNMVHGIIFRMLEWYG